MLNLSRNNFLCEFYDLTKKEKKRNKCRGVGVFEKTKEVFYNGCLLLETAP